jgi:hypothetical protein
MFGKYKIENEDVFDIKQYPEIEIEITNFLKHSNHLHNDHKAQVMISFLRDHCVKTSLLQENEEFVRMIRSGLYSLTKTEELFDACKQNHNFTDGLEAYISTTLLVDSS